MDDPVRVDARGMRCPWPAIRLSRAMREHPGGPVLILADDPIAPGEIAALAAAQGWTVMPAEDSTGWLIAANRA
ncbi:sulfurtransferase TusA family protein [Sphingomonadaceae bacterium G21617-S1]|jgi:tRNA 2-thiouridine synthesizing protein A|uniref:sulfurtransferase TusA family protein n=1 Tax=Rhizorhabdus sp. TaxID=1968843 RepID=UPI0019AEAED4|nr:sulfurtransferase TusA family protein [Rhizorhabdus sp.]MBD3762150.1 sulfurtransferase TusA family protein [Rhizorhabdus sp.]MCZ4340245.1 sulfurtransferase TusA family protein [Sphingomonadaceae bacterium G21617-S1]